jgi:DNA-binding transcriptional MerR regulator
VHHIDHHDNHQMDNNLPPYQSKLARLRVECSDPELLKDCMPNQKWKCINEDGRWRKHKCKFHREVQHHLAEVNKYLSAQSRRNCACFTPDGVVYTKIKSERDIFQPKQKRHRSQLARSRRETADEVDEIYIDHVPPEFLDLLRMDEVVENLQNSVMNQSENHENSRKKRESADYITQTLDELNTVLGSIEKKYENISSESPVQCFVESSGKVNCSTVVYENEAAWKKSRVQVDMLIKVLKNKITNLKDIKRHLKENRPMNMTYDEANYSTSIEDYEKSEEVDEVIQTKAPKRKITNTPRHHNGTERKRKQKASTSTTTEDFASSVLFTTENDEVVSSSVTQEPKLDEQSSSTTAASSSSSQRPKTRTKVPRTTSTTSSTTETSTSEDYNYSEISENFSTSEFPDILSTTEALKTTTIQGSFDAKSVTIDATIIEPKPRHKNRQNALGNGVNVNVTSTNEDELQRHVPADCYCEPEFER